MGAQTPLKWHLEYRRQYLNGCGGVAEGRGHHDGARNGGAGTNSIKMALILEYRRQYLDGWGGGDERGHHDGARNGGGGGYKLH